MNTQFSTIIVIVRIIKMKRNKIITVFKWNRKTLKRISINLRSWNCHILAHFHGRFASLNNNVMGCECVTWLKIYTMKMKIIFLSLKLKVSFYFSRSNLMIYNSLFLWKMMMDRLLNFIIACALLWQLFLFSPTFYLRGWLFA